MNIRHILLTMAAAMCFAATTRSQTSATYHQSNYYFRTIDTGKGLSQNTVTAIIQDRHGFMWFATKDGLDRYNGLQFHHFNKYNSGLSCNYVSALLEDESGKIWIGTLQGVFVYDPQTEKIQSLHDYSGGKVGEIANYVSEIAQSSDGDIYISTLSAGLLRYNVKSGRISNVLPDFILDRNITHFWFVGDVLYFSLYNDNIYYCDKSQKTYFRFEDESGDYPFEAHIIEDSQLFPGGNKMYISGSKGVFEVNLNNGHTRQLLGIYSRALTIRSGSSEKNGARIPTHELWIGTDEGVYIYHIESDEMEKVGMPLIPDSFTLSDQLFYSICCDNENGIWLGSYFGGVNYFCQSNQQFQKYYPSTLYPDFGLHISDICRSDSQTLWIGTEDRGLFYMDSLSNIHHIDDSRVGSGVRSLCVDGNDLWVGNASDGLVRLDLRSKQVVGSYSTSDSQHPLLSDFIFSMMRTKDGDIEVGCALGLMRYDRGSDQFMSDDRFFAQVVLDMLESADGSHWYATYFYGLFHATSKSDTLVQYKNKPGDPGSLPSNMVIGLYEDSARRLWVMTQGGLCLFHPEDGSFESLDMGSEQNISTVYRIQEDSAHQLWMSTNNGLVCYNPSTKERRVYTTANGLLSNHFNNHSGYTDPDGRRMYFGTTSGMISFDPAQLTSPSPSTSHIELSDFMLNDSPVKIGDDSSLDQSITEAESIELSSNENTFSLNAAVMSYQSPEANEIQFRLDGFEEEWKTASNGVIRYENLPYGRYELQVRGKDSNGQLCKEERRIGIRIRPPFYQSSWAYLLYLLLAGLGVYAIIRFYSRRTQERYKSSMQELELEKERELYTSKINFFTHVAHEIRTPLTLIRGPLESIVKSGIGDESTRSDLQLMQKNTDRLVQLINKLLDFRKAEINEYRLNFISMTVCPLLNDIVSQFTSAAQQQGLTIDVEADEHLKASLDEEAFRTILSNLLGNAVKFASSTIRVRLLQEGEEMKVTVENDGAIIPSDKRNYIFEPFHQLPNSEEDGKTGTGIGLALSRTLSELHGGSLQMDSDETTNRFVLTLPTHQKDELPLYSEAEAGTSDEKTEEESYEESLPTILFADDNQDLQTYIKRHLSSHYNVVVCGNGQEALDLLSTRKFDLIVSDVMMPVMDGFELCSTVKQTLEYSHIPVVLLTAKTTLTAHIEGMRQGADAYIEKPFSPELLEATISNLLTSRNQLYEHFAHNPFFQSKDIAVSSPDQKFLEEMQRVIRENMQDQSFDVDALASGMAMSRSTLNRKTKGLLNQSPSDFIRIERLKLAASLLKSREYQVNEVCYMVGFSTPSYFSRLFQNQFGMLPKDFINNLPSD